MISKVLLVVALGAVEGRLLNSRSAHSHNKNNNANSGLNFFILGDWGHILNLVWRLSSKLLLTKWESLAIKSSLHSSSRWVTTFTKPAQRTRRIQSGKTITEASTPLHPRMSRGILFWATMITTLEAVLKRRSTTTTNNVTTVGLFPTTSTQRHGLFQELARHWRLCSSTLFPFALNHRKTKSDGPTLPKPSP